MAYGDTFSAVQDASLREKAMRDQNINAAFSRMMAVRGQNQQYALAQQQMALEHEKLKASTMAAAMAHDQQMRHNDILEKQVDGYLDLQKRQVDKNFETDDHMGQALADNLHEATTSATDSEKNYELSKNVFNETQDRVAELQKQGFITFDKSIGRYRGIPDKSGANDTNKMADDANQRLMQRKADLDEAQRKYEYDAKHHAHIIDVATSKGFLHNGKTGELIDMQRGKKFAPSNYQMPVNPGSSTTNGDQTGASNGSATGNGYTLPVNTGDTDYGSTSLPSMSDDYKGRVKKAMDSKKLTYYQARHLLETPSEEGFAGIIKNNGFDSAEFAPPAVDSSPYEPAQLTSP